MRRPPLTTWFVSVATLLAVLGVFVTPAAAQQSDSGLSPLAEAFVSMGITLVVSGGLIAFAPDFTARTTQRVHNDPVGTFGWGVVLGIAAIIALVILFISIIGIILAIPLAIVLTVVSGVGYLAAGRTVSDDWGIVLVIAIGIAAIVGGLPVIGDLIGFIISSFGMGAVFLEYSDDNPSRENRPTSDSQDGTGSSSFSPPRRR